MPDLITYLEWAEFYDGGQRLLMRVSNVEVALLRDLRETLFRHHPMGRIERGPTYRAEPDPETENVFLQVANIFLGQ